MTKTSAVKRHFVTFYSPGTLFAEHTTKPIDSWDVDKAVEMATGFTERYGAKAFGFRFSTRERGPKDLDSHETKRSGMYFLSSGTVETLAEIEARNDPKEEILRSNMRGNGWNRIVRGASPWLWAQPLGPDDVVLKAPRAK